MDVLVCDDRRDGFEAVEAAIGQRHAVRSLVGQDLRRELERLFESIRAAMPEVGAPRTALGTVDGGAFDNVDVAIIDNNLAALEIAGARLTAETLIGYVRAFTSVGYIVSINKNPDVDFDLRYLVGDYQSQADLALNTGHLSNVALWEGRSAADADSQKQFAPWYWPNLTTAAALRRRQIDWIEAHLDKPLLSSLKFPYQSLAALSRRAKGALSSDVWDETSLQEVRFLDFFANACHSVPALDRTTLREAADAKDQAARAAVARLTAADLEKWIRRDVVGPQDVLVDLPHLLTRMPFLLGEKASDVHEWNRLLLAGLPSLDSSGDVYETHLTKARFRADDMWLDVPCFWWPILKADEHLSKLFFAAEETWADAVFCEDVSRFITFSDSEAAEEGTMERLTPFEAEFEGSWTRRYVALVGGKQYSPRSRFAR